MSKPFVSRLVFSSGLCSAAACLGTFSSSGEKVLRPTSTTTFSVWLEGAVETEGGLSGSSGWGLSSSEQGLRDTMTGSGREVKGWVRTECS